MSHYDDLLRNKIYKPKKKEVINLVNDEEKSFYKLRVFDLCKRILINQYDPDTPLDLILTFEGFMKQSIEYFRAKDKSDILQSELVTFDTINNSSNTNFLDDDNTTDIPHFFISKPVTFLEKHAMRKKPHTQITRITLPVEREYDLRNPNLQKKGVLDFNFDNNNNIDDLQNETSNEKNQELFQNSKI
jgi:hypothetical protein